MIKRRCKKKKKKHNIGDDSVVDNPRGRRLAEASACNEDVWKVTEIDEIVKVDNKQTGKLENI